MPEQNARRRRNARGPAALLVGGLMLTSLHASGAGAPTTEWTDASWSGAQTVAGSVQAGVVPTPTNVRCVGGGVLQNPTVHWEMPSGATSPHRVPHRVLQPRTARPTTGRTGHPGPECAERAGQPKPARCDLEPAGRLLRRADQSPWARRLDLRGLLPHDDPSGSRGRSRRLLRLNPSDHPRFTNRS